MKKKEYLANIFGVATENIKINPSIDYDDNIIKYYINDRVDVKKIPDDFLLEDNINIFLNLGGEFENCSFKNKIFFEKIKLIGYCKFKNCVFDNNNLNIMPSSQFLGCSFENIDNFLEFASKNTFKECFYKSDLKLYGNEEKEKEYQKKIKISNFTFNNKVELIGKIFEEEVHFEKVVFEDKVDFNHSIFNKNIHCYECEFKKQLNFENCKFIESKGYTDNSLRFKEVRFNDIANFKNSVFDVEVNFDDFVFSNVANFTKSTFKKNASFKNCNFNKLSGDDFFDFSEIDFKDNVYFDNSDFDEFVAFHLCVFEKTASFYKTKFNVIPNFSPGDFKGILNINNATWGQNGNLEFEDVENIVDEACGKSETEKEKLETEKEKLETEKEKLETEKEKLETIRNIKDSFRAIKNVLIQKKDQLEAQKFHKAELYCKELELEKENKNFSTYIDSLLLKIYRITSDHHTNFLKILNFTVFCIAVYAVCSFVFVDIYTATFFGESRIFSKNTSEDFFSGLTFVLTCLIIIVILRKYTLKNLILIILAVIFIGFVALFIKPDDQNFVKWLVLILVIMLLLLSLYFCNNEHKGIILFVLLFFCFFTIPVSSSIVYFLSDKDKNYDLLFKITIPAIISTYFCLIIFFSCSLEEKYLRKIKDKNLILSVFKYLVWVFKYLVLVFKYLAWVIVAFVLYLYPQLINPFVGVFKSDEILSTNYFEKKLNDLNASEIIEISNLLKNITDLNLTKVHKEIIDLNTITNAGIINAKELIKQNLKEINIANNELNATINTINDLKEKKDLQEYLVNGIKSSSLVYSIILLLCLYSLTKTARKNSIVPI
ncbi:pentapeptide repeat-containing protein [Campylobacter sp.]|uniref:pentapeptide repeat-containing protein n=1 Tax=Campylobacter sp. TaxID=205 RepID=UPI002A7F68B2|nr:pentapeptide repeat-containing protein [Campylobacter sp.]MDY4804165.1 pentapeptide repeat-containing protein [Campylobacter sp.]